MKPTGKDYAAFKDGRCVSVAFVLEGKGADQFNAQFYQENAGCEIRILPRDEALDAFFRDMQEL